MARVFSLGVALSSCHPPQDPDAAVRHHPGQAELGIDIYGEPGSSVIHTQNSQQIIKLMVDKLLAALPATGRLVMMLHSPSGVPVTEMAVLNRELVHSALAGRIDWLIRPAALVSALDIKGFSITVMVMEGNIEKALMADVETANGQTLVRLRSPRIMPCALQSARVAFQPSENNAVGHYMDVVTQTLSSLESVLNALDAKVGDGDTGSTFAAGAHEIASLHQQNQLPLNQLETLCALIGERLTVVMGGSSGVLITATGQSLQNGESVVTALQTGLAQMKFYGGADLGDRTLIDALQPALEALTNQPDDLKNAYLAAEAGAEKTYHSAKANAGRSSYLNSDSLVGNMDPGAHAIAMVFKAQEEHA